MPTYTITYEKVTPESASDGDVSERGFYMPDGWKYPLPDGLYRDAFRKWRDEMGPFDLDLTYTRRDDPEDGEDPIVLAAIDTLNEYGCTENGGDGSGWYGVDPFDVDYSTGETTRIAVHFDGLTDDQIAAVVRGMGGK